MTLEEQMLPFVERLHDQMRAMYAIPPMSMSSQGDLKEVKEMKTGPLGSGGWNTLSLRQVPPEDKTLLSKPHPENCICPKCISHPAHVLPVIRIGDAERNKTLALLDERFASGHLTLAEFQARADVVLAATMKDELACLVKDLPPVPERKKIVVPEKTRWNRSWWYAASAMILLGNAGFSEIVAGSGVLCVIFLACAVAMSCVWLAKR